MVGDDVPDDPDRRVRVSPVVDRLGALSWRLVGIALAAWGLLRLLDALRLVVFPVLVAILLAVVLVPPARWLRTRRWPPLLAVWTVFLGLFALVALAVAAVVPPLAEGFGRLGPTIGEAAEGIEAWLADDSPFRLDRQRLAGLRAQGVEAVRRSFAAPGGIVFQGAVLFVEVVAGMLLAFVLAFFFVKDGERFQRFVLARLPRERRDTARRMGATAWGTLAGYLRGSAMLGTLEAAIIGVTLALVSAGLVVPVVVLTFVAAFVPFVGAVVAAIVAVLVTMVTAGAFEALIVAAVALAVQQLDNDLLAPVVFGKALDLHPVVVLLALASGVALAGIAGAFLAVPLTAVVLNVTAEVADGDAVVEL